LWTSQALRLYWLGGWVCRGDITLDPWPFWLKIRVIASSKCLLRPSGPQGQSGGHGSGARGCMHLLLYAWAVQADVCEVLYTFMLCFMNVVVAKENMKNHFYGLAFSHVIVASAYGACAVSGG
jgi:hypothetical protein